MGVRNRSVNDSSYVLISFSPTINQETGTGLIARKADRLPLHSVLY